MKTLMIAATAVLMALVITPLHAESMTAEGQWRTIDDETGEARSIVRVWVDGGELKGQIVELLNPTEPNPVCSDCKGSRKDQPIEGMTFLWGLEQDGDGWEGGRILDPSNGKEYSAKATVIDNGAKLEVRGFLGFALLGRTQVWERVE
jgi:uncharacterized protein (DUF2147 family)